MAVLPLLRRSSKDNGCKKLRWGTLIPLACIPVYFIGVRVGSQQSSNIQQSVRMATLLEGPKTVPAAPPITNALEIPRGEVQALPSIREATSEDDRARESYGTKYGGAGDKLHLGGFTAYDPYGVSPAVWKYMIGHLGIKSVMDVGCGRGISTLYFLEHGVDILCLEGSHDAVENTLLPDPENQIVEHDFSRGPYWPSKTYDAVWSVEFLEHVGRNYQYNYIQAFRKAALIFVTFSSWGGWHHVEVHEKNYWVTKYQMFGFQFSQVLTDEIIKLGIDEAEEADKNTTNPDNLGPDGKPWNAQHIWTNMLVFINPAVAGMPEHAHLLAEPGCYQPSQEGHNLHRHCEKGMKESELPERFLPLEVTKEKHNAWMAKVKARTIDFVTTLPHGSS